MAMTDIQRYLDLVQTVKQSPRHVIWLSYDEEADVLFINFKKPSRAPDSAITEDDVIVRYEDDDVIGITVLHAAYQ